jgi:hypothetical protein
LDGATAAVQSILNASSLLDGELLLFKNPINGIQLGWGKVKSHTMWRQQKHRHIQAQRIHYGVNLGILMRSVPPFAQQLVY